MWNNTHNTTKGTARGKSDWPPKEIGKISIRNIWYNNSLYYMNDRVGNYQFFCWINNNIVKIVSILAHQVMSMFLINRRKSRINEFNRKHVKLIWSDQHRKQLKRPQVINDYTHRIMGVDVVNQLIVYYYRPEIWCHRTWMPILLHCLNILLRVNLHVLCKETSSYNHADVGYYLKPQTFLDWICQ